MSDEKLCLQWNDFHDNVISAFKEFRDDKDFTDLTLACDDEQLQAHKVILSTFSPFFRDLLKDNKHTHPLIYMRGVQGKYLSAIVDFIYQGEANIAEKDIIIELY